ncbi:hypothetical protein BGK46_13460 [Salinivibrio sp. SS2]|nr:hypothetical protein BGK46_13460 [Salinivibrio sp. DV]
MVGNDHSLTKNIAIAAYGRLSKRTPPKKAGFVSNLKQLLELLFLYCACDRKLNNDLLQAKRNAIYIKTLAYSVSYNRAVRYQGHLLC